MSFRYFGTALCKWCDKRGDNHREHLHLYLRRPAQNTKEQQWEKQKSKDDESELIFEESLSNRCQASSGHPFALPAATTPILLSIDDDDDDDNNKNDEDANKNDDVDVNDDDEMTGQFWAP